MEFTTFFFDLDDTLYPANSGVWNAIRERIDRYLLERIGIPREEINTVRNTLTRTYGTTLRGLQMTRAVDEQDYLAYVHNVPVDRLLSPAPGLRALLRRYPQRKIIFTNADTPHALRVLNALQIRDCFDQIIDIHAVAPYCKPMPETYPLALRLAGEPEAARCVFLDDSPTNLQPAQQSGWYTIRVGSREPSAAYQAAIRSLEELPTVLPLNGVH